MKKLLTIALLLTTLSTRAQYTVQSVPNQKLINGSYVSNPDNILSSTTTYAIDTLLKSLETKTTVQVAVVAVKSIGNEDIFDFAQKLFTTWGIGNKEKDNGLLLLLVTDNHTVRFHTGQGLEAALPDAICKRIQTQYMVPEFKAGNYDAGVLIGLEQASKIITNPTYAAELTGEAPTTNDNPWTGFIIVLLAFIAPGIMIWFFIKRSIGQFADSKKKDASPYPEMYLSQRAWLLIFIGMPALIICFFGFVETGNPVGNCVLMLYLYFMGTQVYKLVLVRHVIKRFLAVSDYYAIVEFLRKGQWYWFFIGLLFPPFILYFFYHLVRKRLYRNHPRQCKVCHGNLRKLSEKTEDVYLSEVQQFEEKLRSVNYDVWQCDACHEVEEWNYPNRHSKYSECPFCKTHAYYRSGKSTITSATYSSSGKGEETYTCKFCSKSKKSTYSIPMLVRSSDNSSSGYSSSSGSSGGSWGGGSSGGGGASSSW